MTEITGGTLSLYPSSVSLSIAKALGEQNMNIVLTDINEENLQKACLELEANKVSVKLLRMPDPSTTKLSLNDCRATQKGCTLW